MIILWTYLHLYRTSNNRWPHYCGQYHFNYAIIPTYIYTIFIVLIVDHNSPRPAWWWCVSRTTNSTKGIDLRKASYIRTDTERYRAWDRYHNHQAATWGLAITRLRSRWIRYLISSTFPTTTSSDIIAPPRVPCPEANWTQPQTPNHYRAPRVPFRGKATTPRTCIAILKR